MSAAAVGYLVLAAGMVVVAGCAFAAAVLWYRERGRGHNEPGR